VPARSRVPLICSAAVTKYFPVYRYKPVHRRLSNWAYAVFAWTAIGLIFVTDGLAVPLERPPQQAVAVVKKGVVWFDEGPIFFERFGSEKMRLGPGRLRVLTRGPVVSSARAVIVGGGQREGAEEANPRFLVSALPGAFESIRYPPLFGDAGCKGWEPSGPRVLAGDELVVAGRCFWDDPFSRQPLFIRSLHGGRWHVLRWLTGEYEPVLAAEGSLLAVGVQHSLAQMDVSILDLHNGRVHAHFTLPDGYLSFASRDRLMLSSPTNTTNGVCFPLDEPCRPYRSALYSTHGQHITELSISREPPLVSDMHLLADEYGEAPGIGEYQTLSVRNLAGGSSGGAPRSVIGYNSPARALVALAFRWPALAVVETTSTPLLPSEIHCWSGDYGPASKPFLQIFDLARDEAFRPAPPIVHVQPSQPLTNCGPPPR
jgi:hypothetical protein